MTDNMTPQLTLDPTAAAAEAVPTLTLTPEAPEAPQVEEEKKIEPVEMDEKLLTDAEKKAVEDFSHKIDIRDTNMILQYGAAAQKSVAGFSENALNSGRTSPAMELPMAAVYICLLIGFGLGVLRGIQQIVLHVMNFNKKELTTLEQAMADAAEEAAAAKGDLEGGAN